MPPRIGRKDIVFGMLLSLIIGIYLFHNGTMFRSVFFLALLGLVCSLLFRAKIPAAATTLFFFALLCGYVYAFAYQTIILKLIRIPEGAPYRVLVTESVRRESYQKLTAKLQDPYRGTIDLFAEPYPIYEYGDMLLAEGEISKRNSSYASFYPEIEHLSSGGGSFIKRGMLAFRESVLENYRGHLPDAEAALLGGLTLGAKAEMPPELTEGMKLSGTTHLVALSGYNIGLVILGVGSLFASWLSRRLTFTVTVLVIILLVMMTGGEASIIRASLMGILVLMAGESGRMYDARGAIVFAAALMALINPELPHDNLGFQLSFLSLIGITYLAPVFGAVENTRFSYIWEAMRDTASAQVMVMPLLFYAFGSVSANSVFANTLILPAIPLTMFFGFLLGSAEFISHTAALLIAPLAHLLLAYELFIIRVFAEFPAVFRLSIRSPYIFFAYYALIFSIITSRKNRA